MRLLYAFPEPLPLPRARGVQVAHAVSSLADTGLEIDLAYVRNGDASPFEPTGLPVPAKVKLVPLSRSWPAPLDRLPPFARWHSVRFFAARLLKAVERSQPDAIYVRHIKLASRLAQRGDLPPMVYEAHEVFADTAPARRRGQVAGMERSVVRGVAGVVCNSAATAERLVALYGKPHKLIVLPNGVARSASLPDKSWADCQRHIVYAGSFFGWKGVADLVAAAGELPGFRITLIGGEPEQVRRLNLPAGGAEIEILPRLPQDAVMQRLAASCIAVLPNRPDPDSAFTSPIKLFEYMAAGCAVVASDLRSIREILGDGEAAWFAPGDVASLATALRALAGDCATARRMGERLREKSSDYTWARRAERLRDFLAAVGSK